MGVNEDEACTCDPEAAQACQDLLAEAECEDEAALINNRSDVFTGDDRELDLTTLL